MAGRSHLCSGPEEILFYIVEHLRTPDDLIHRRDWTWPHGPAIRFANDQVLHLSQANHLFRRLCLPLLYEHIIIRLTKTSLPTANGSSHALPSDLFRRTMKRKPHLAELVRFIEVEGYLMGLDTSHHTFDSLPFLPKIKRIDFPRNVKLDQDFLSVINSHPSLLTVHWRNIDALSFPNHLSLPHGALSRVLVNSGELSEYSHSIELLWLYFAKLGLRVKNLIVRGETPPQFLSLTYPDLYSISVDVFRLFSSHGPEPLGWFPSFLERHPQLEVISIWLNRSEGRLAWEALKNIPITRPLYDASHSRGLISSFSFEYIITGVERATSAAIVVDSPQDLPEIIHLLGSMLPIPVITLQCHTLEPHFLPINVNDFVSAFQENHKTLSSLRMCAVCKVLDLDSLSADEELYLNDTDIEEDLLSDSLLRDITKQLAKLTRLLCAGSPRLKNVVYEGDVVDDGPGFDWKFSVSGDGQVELVELRHIDVIYA